MARVVQLLQIPLKQLPLWLLRLAYGLLEHTVGWTTADADVLLKHANIFRQQAEAMVDSWRAVMGAQGHLSQGLWGQMGSLARTTKRA